MTPKTFEKTKISKEDIINDYRLAYMSRQTSYIGRREVLSGKAKFGIFGDGKEVAQIAMAKAFNKGDFRSGYYRDQTFMFAIGEHTIEEFFAQLYSNNNLKDEPASGGRAMNAHFSTRSLDESGNWLNLMEIRNSTSDVSPTGSQMPRLVGLAYASRLYRELGDSIDSKNFSNNGNEIAFGTIGNASCAEGMFWESINALSVLRAPAIVSIWDDGYGISVPNEYQFVRDLSELLSGFQREKGSKAGYDLYRVPAWDYLQLIDVYQKAAIISREDHVPAIVHVYDGTQPLGHSSSGSHERYKSSERLQWEKDFDCVLKFKQWIIEQDYASYEELGVIEKECKDLVEEIRKESWERVKVPIHHEIAEFVDILDKIIPLSLQEAELNQTKRHLRGLSNPSRKDIMVAIREGLLILRDEHFPEKQLLINWKNNQTKKNQKLICSHLYSQSSEATLLVEEVKPIYDEESLILNGFEILNQVFDSIFERDPRVVAFGEDLGFIGGVNQSFSGLQEKFGKSRVSDTGIREATILGQAIGLALRGFRPIAEIQYLDYLLYALQIMADDLATLHWRTVGGQKAPVIVRTRGHRLEGIWHSGSMMSGIINLVRGMYVLVPRNMVQAAGFYNTLLKGDDPAIVVEVLNGYRLKERLPENIKEFTLPIGIPEILRHGDDFTVVTYGPLCRIALDAAEVLEELGICVEIIDVRSLLPFDINGMIVESLKRTNRILFLDEDVPGGTTAYMMQKVLEDQGGFQWLDSEPKTLSGKQHRPAYGSDGNYWSKPNVESIVECIYNIFNEVDPGSYPSIF